MIMCGFYGHGFLIEEERVVMSAPPDLSIFRPDALFSESCNLERTISSRAFFDFRHNSHHDILQQHKFETDNHRRLSRCGFYPDNLKFCSQDISISAAAENELKINQWLSGIFVSRWQIVQWIKNNYGKYGDLREWQISMPKLLRPDAEERVLAIAYDNLKPPAMGGYSASRLSPSQYLDVFLRGFGSAPNDFWASKSDEKKSLPEYVELSL